jgi:hypothetical protein
MVNEQKTAALESSGTITMSGPLEKTSRRRRNEAMQLILRALCMGSSIVSLSLMITAKQNKSVPIYGFQLPVQSKWSFSQSYE